MIRLATEDDHPAVLALLERFHAENGIARLNREKVEREVWALIELADLFVAEEDEGVIVGALGIVQNEIWYSSQQRLDDRFVYVVPEARSRSIGSMLLRAATLEAQRRNLPLFVSVTNPSKAQKRGRVAEIIGYQPIGHTSRLR